MKINLSNLHMIRSFSFVLLLSTLFIVSCTNDEAEPEASADCVAQTDLSFATHIKPIIDGSCAFVGCHGAGSVNGVFTDYASMQSLIDNGKFNDEVVVKRTMPPGGQLDTDKFTLIKCWVEANYPE